MSSVTALLPIKGEQDVYRFNKILKPSLERVEDLNVIIVTDEKITESDSIKVISDEEVFSPDGPITGWGKQQIIKLKSHQIVDTKWILTLDADCYFKYKGSVNEMIPDGKPYINTGSVNSTPSNLMWWDNASSALGVSIPSVCCQVTPMFIRTDVCRDLDRLHDLEALIKSKCTEYTLYWLFGILRGVDWSQEYTFEPLLTSSIWHKGDVYSKFLQRVDKSLKSDTTGKLGLVQSAAQRKFNVNYRKIVDDISEIITSNLIK